MPKLAYRTKLPRPDDPDVYEPICAAIALGMSQEKAAAKAGIHEDTLYHWRYKGQRELAAAEGQWKPWRELGSHAQLVIRLKEAEAALEFDGVTNWREGKVNDWARWATLLQRRDPERWNVRENSGAPSVTIGTVNVLNVGGDNLAAAERVLARLAGRAVLPQLSSPGGEGDTAIDVSSSPTDAT